MIPEMVGFAIMLHAFVTLATGLPLFLISLLFRIRVEEQVLKKSSKLIRRRRLCVGEGSRSV
jgi:isoprenylcysteine carboxyl methyltransferase (ICMT) family protein YpbQ